MDKISSIQALWMCILYDKNVVRRYKNAFTSTNTSTVSHDSIIQIHFHIITFPLQCNKDFHWSKSDFSWVLVSAKYFL